MRMWKKNILFRSPKQAMIRLVNRVSIFVIYPIFLLIIGILIHTYNLISMVLGQTEWTIWALWVHFFMFFFDLFILIGIIRMKRMIYLIFIFALLLMTTAWIIDSIMRKNINLSTLLGIVFCSMAVPVMMYLFRKLKSGYFF